MSSNTDSNDNWTCQTCTFAGNPSLFLACGICSAPRRSQLELTGQQHKQQKTKIQAHPAITDAIGLKGKRVWKEIDSRESKQAAEPAQSKKPRALKKSSNQSQSLPDSLKSPPPKELLEIKSMLPKTPAASKANDSKDSARQWLENCTSNVKDSKFPPRPVRRPPKHSTSIHNLSDRQYCCVWAVEVFDDGYRPDVARMLLAKVARHVNPILRDRGWRVKRLMESASSSWIGLCTTNGRNDADACSTNIQLNVRVLPNKHCRQFRPFRQILGVMLHEITHTSIGLEDIHPPAFYELLDEIKIEYKQRLANGKVDLETDQYGCQETVVTASGIVQTIEKASEDLLGPTFLKNSKHSQSTEMIEKFQQGEECGATKVKKSGRRRRQRRSSAGGGRKPSGYQSSVSQRRPLLKGVKMIDGRTKQGKISIAERRNLTPKELAARAAVERFGHHQQRSTNNGNNNEIKGNSKTIKKKETYNDNHKDNENVAVTDLASISSDADSEIEINSDDEAALLPHSGECGCRACDWDKLLFMPKKQENMGAS